MRDEIAIITGASSGMGALLVKKVWEENANLKEIWLISRNEKKLQELVQNLPALEDGDHPICRIFPWNLREEAEREKLYHLIEEEKPMIRYLIQSAGYGVGGAFIQGSREEEVGMVELNAVALTDVAYSCVPYMVNGSSMMNLASSAAFLPQPYFAVYAATKSYVLSFSRALGRELKKRGIHVIAVCPGPVDTPFYQNFERYVEIPATKKMFRVKPEKVVDLAWKDMKRKRAKSIYGFAMRAVEFASKILPHGLILKFYQSK